MSFRDLSVYLQDQIWIAIVVLAVPPALSFLLGYTHARGQGGESAIRYLYSVIVYLACIPGMLASVVTCYTLFFTFENLLDVNLVVYILPIVTMIVTMVIVGKNADFDRLPGFDRLSGLMVSLAITFIFALAIQKTRLWLFFGGSIMMLIAIAAGLFALLQWGSYMLFRGRDEPKKKPPAFPTL